MPPEAESQAWKPILLEGLLYHRWKGMVGVYGYDIIFYIYNHQHVLCFLANIGDA